MQLLQNVIVKHLWPLRGQRHVSYLKAAIEFFVFSLFDISSRLYLPGGLNKRIPLDSGKEATEEVWVEVGFTESKFHVAKFEGKVVCSATFGMTCKEVMGDKTDHRRGVKTEGGTKIYAQSGPVLLRSRVRECGVRGTEWSGARILL